MEGEGSALRNTDAIMSEGGANLTHRVAKSALWIVGARFVMRALGFVNTIVLARLLTPDAFGVVAIATAGMQLLQGFTDFGVSQAVIKFRTTGREALDPLFTLSAARGVVITIMLVAAAPLAAQFYDDERVFWVFAGIAAYPFLTGFSNPAFHEYERDLELSKEFWLNAVNKLISVATSIAIAVTFRNYWAIIGGLAAAGAVQLILSYAMRPYLPRFTFKGAREVLSFSGWLFGVSAITALNNKIDMFVAARVMTPTEVGLYSVGGQFAELPTSEIAAPIARAVYPGLSVLQGEPDRVTAAYLKGVEAMSVIAFPAAFGLSFVARDATPLLLGPQWIDAIQVVQLVTPVLGFQAAFLATYYYALALGKARLVFFRELIYFVLRFPIFLWACLSYGFMGAIYASAGMGFIRVALGLLVYRQASGRRAYEPLLKAGRAMLATAVMCAYFLFVRPLIDLPDSVPLLRLAIDVAAGAAVYALALLGIWRASGGPEGVEAQLWSAAQRTLRRAQGV